MHRGSNFYCTQRWQYECTGLKAVSYPDTRRKIKGNTVQFSTDTRIFYIVCYGHYFLIMQETIKRLKVKGLYVVSTKSSSFRWCRLMADKHELPIRNYTSRPIEKITDFIKLFEEYLSHLDWELDEYTDEHGKAILKMERKLQINDLGRWVVS